MVEILGYGGRRTPSEVSGKTNFPHDEAEDVKQVHLIRAGIANLITDFHCEKRKGFHEEKFWRKLQILIMGPVNGYM